MGANKRGGAERGSASASTMPPVAKGKAAAADTDAAGTNAAGNPKDALGKRNVSFTRTRVFVCVRPALFASRARPNVLGPTPSLPAQRPRYRPGDRGLFRPVGCAPARAPPPPSEAGWINAYKRLQTERYFCHPPIFSVRL